MVYYFSLRITERRADKKLVLKLPASTANSCIQYRTALLMIAKKLSLTYDSAHKVEVGEVVGVDGRVRVDLQRIDVVATKEESRINICDICKYAPIFCPFHIA
jgi:hypothetical protein